MLTRMSESPSGDLHETAAAEGPGILAGLPRTRPQRTSARRAASRAAAAREAPRAPANKATHSPARKAPRAPTHEATPPPARKSPDAPTRNAARPPTRKSPRKARHSAASGREPTGESVPLQGYEPEDGALSRTIQPPGGAELVASVAELAGELAKAGVNTGGRWLRDVFSRLPSG